jgi:hypothetical protein
MGQSLAFSRRANSASTASRMKSPRLFARPITASMRSRTAGESRTVVSFTPRAGRPMRRVVSDSCKSDKPIAFMLTAETDSPYITTIGYGDKSMAISPSGYTADFGPNVEQILAQGTRKIVGKVPAQIRKELRAAVKAGVLHHLPKDGLKPEVFYHPNCRNSAIWLRDREAEYAIKCIAGVVGFNPQMRGVEPDQ